MADQFRSSFAIIRFNQRTYEPGGVAAVVKDRGLAEQVMAEFQAGQSEESRHGGWRFFIEESNLTPGMDAEKATKLRELRFARQELEA
jgi:hypothetical protein